LSIWHWHFGAFHLEIITQRVELARLRASIPKLSGGHTRMVQTV
jgi:hypothetical protein